MEHESYSDINLVGALGIELKGMEKRLRELEIREKIDTIPDHSTIKISLSTLKTPRDIMPFAVTQTSV